MSREIWIQGRADLVTYHVAFTIRTLPEVNVLEEKEEDDVMGYVLRRRWISVSSLFGVEVDADHVSPSQ